MPILLYDLAGVDGRRFSPACWRIRMALEHKGLDYETHPTPFTGIRGICDGQQTTLPVIEDQGKVIRDSWQIARYLEVVYPDRPSLFGCGEGEQYARFVESWVGSAILVNLFGMIVADIHDHVLPQDKEYFRESREKRLGCSLEEAQKDRESRMPKIQDALKPLQAYFSQADFMGGKRPSYADYVLFGTFQWVRATSPLKLIARQEPLGLWFERCLDLYDGVGRRAPGYD